MMGREVGCVNSPGVIDNRTNRGRSSVEPAVLVNLPDGEVVDRDQPKVTDATFDFKYFKFLPS